MAKDIDDLLRDVFGNGKGRAMSTQKAETYLQQSRRLNRGLDALDKQQEDLNRRLQNQLDELKKMYPYDGEYWIESLSKYMASTGRTYQNHFATICMWADKEKTKKKKRNYSFPEGASL